MKDANAYSEIKQYFSNDEDVEVGVGRGAQGLKYKKKMFVMFHKGSLLVKLSEARIQELIAEGEGLPHDPGTGKPMRDRILISSSNKEKWLDYCLESKDFVRS